MLTKSQETDGWGKKTLQRLAVDLKNEYPERKGFSVRNMQCMMQFYNEYNKELTMVKVGYFSIAQPAVAQLKNNVNTLPIKHLNWTHNIILLQRVKDLKARYWYMVQCITGHWSKDYLAEAIKLNFYCSAIDDTLCREGDNKTIGLLLCKTKDRIKAEYALRDIQKPIGVSDYELGQALPKDFRSNLPSIEEIEKGLNEWNQE